MASLNAQPVEDRLLLVCSLYIDLRERANRSLLLHVCQPCLILFPHPIYNNPFYAPRCLLGFTVVFLGGRHSSIRFSV